MLPGNPSPEMSPPPSVLPKYEHLMTAPAEGAGEPIAPPIGPEVTHHGEVGTIAADESAPALGGLRRMWHEWRVSRLEPKAEEISGDIQVYKDAGRGSLAQKNQNPYAENLEPRYDPLRTFAESHRMTRQQITDKKLAARAREDVVNDTKPRARTTLQQFASLRNNARLDAVNRREKIIQRATESYDDIIDPAILHDKDALDTHLKTGRYTRGQRKAMAAAGKRVRKADASTSRIYRRLHKSAHGADIPGTYKSLRARRVQRKLEHHEEHLGR